VYFLLLFVEQAVVAERPYLIQRLLPHFELNKFGCYEVYFCLDGTWNSVLVDSLLPSVPIRKGKRKGTDVNEERRGLLIQPAFASGNVSWPAIVEKAYAKVHGSYARLSGGYISEALYDLTGAPVERIYFHREYDYHQLFARLLSFVSSGFLMGIATNRGGDGLVSCHAYSILGVYEIHDAVEGSQGKITEFVKTNIEEDDEIVVLENPSSDHAGAQQSVSLQQRKTIRLVCIRNPWGSREWKGKWSATSEQWTRKIQRQLGQHDIYEQGNGTFFMAYEDMIQRFDHLDVAKCQEVSQLFSIIFIR
jgi:calpain-15